MSCKNLFIELVYFSVVRPTNHTAIVFCTISPVELIDNGDPIDFITPGTSNRVTLHVKCNCQFIHLYSFVSNLTS